MRSSSTVVVSPSKSSKGGGEAGDGTSSHSPLGGGKMHFTKRTAAVAKKGMRELLQLHNEEELETLCESLRMDQKPTQADTIEDIFSTKLSTFDDYRHVLELMWEGIIIEYLRHVGKRVSNFREDPRVTLLRYWLEDERFQVKGFGRVYVPITIRRDEVRTWEAKPSLDVHRYLRLIGEKEKIMKVMEKKITSTDYRSTLIFFRILSEIRVAEDKFRSYLLDEIVRSHKAEADAVAERNHTRACFDVQCNIMKENVNDSETQMFTQRVFFDLASDGQGRAAWLQKQQDRLVRDIHSYQDEINEMKREILRHKQKNNRLTMKFEDLSLSHARLVRKLDVDVQAMRERMLSELAMSQRECTIHQERNRHLGNVYLRYRNSANEEIERLTMNVEECNQRFGRRRRIKRKPRKKKGGKKNGKKGPSTRSSSRRGGNTARASTGSRKGPSTPSSTRRLVRPRSKNRPSSSSSSSTKAREKSGSASSKKFGRSRSPKGSTPSSSSSSLQPKRSKSPPSSRGISKTRNRKTTIRDRTSRTPKLPSLQDPPSTKKKNSRARKF